MHSNTGVPGLPLTYNPLPLPYIVPPAHPTAFAAVPSAQQMIVAVVIPEGAAGGAKLKVVLADGRSVCCYLYVFQVVSACEF